MRTHARYNGCLGKTVEAGRGWIMLNKRLVTIVLAGAIVAAITGGAVAAQSNDNSSKPFTAKVAATLGIDEISLQDAMKQAKQELYQERLAEKVASGKITQEQADAKLAWRDATPEERKTLRLAKLQANLAEAVASGKITQEKADAKLAWFHSTPAERKAQRLTKLESQLAAAVAVGKITQAQADTKLSKAQTRSDGERGKGKKKHRKGKRGRR